MRQTFFHNRYVLIESKSTKNYNGLVYNLSVWKDESYITEIGISHNCRCYVVQTAEDPTTEKDMPTINENDVKPEFKINVGKTGQIFKEGKANGGKPHPYFALVKNDDDYRVAFELMKHNAPMNKINKRVRENIFADDRSKNSRQENIDHAVMIATNLDLKVDILPHIHLKNYSSPEFKINGIIGDGAIRKGNIKNTINNAFANKFGENGQLSKLDKTFLSVDLGEFKNLSNNEFKSIVTSAYNRLTSHKTVDFLIISHNGKSLIIYNKDIPKNEGYAYVYKQLTVIKSTKADK